MSIIDQKYALYCKFCQTHIFLLTGCLFQIFLRDRSTTSSDLEVNSLKPGVLHCSPDKLIFSCKERVVDIIVDRKLRRHRGSPNFPSHDMIRLFELDCQGNAAILIITVQRTRQKIKYFVAWYSLKVCINLPLLRPSPELDWLPRYTKRKRYYNRTRWQ